MRAIGHNDGAIFVIDFLYVYQIDDYGAMTAEKLIVQFIFQCVELIWKLQHPVFAMEDDFVCDSGSFKRDDFCIRDRNLSVIRHRSCKDRSIMRGCAGVLFVSIENTFMNFVLHCIKVVLHNEIQCFHFILIRIITQFDMGCDKNDKASRFDLSDVLCKQETVGFRCVQIDIQKI